MVDIRDITFCHLANSMSHSLSKVTKAISIAEFSEIMVIHGDGAGVMGGGNLETMDTFISVTENSRKLIL